jgi:phosphoserine phosphatase
MIASAAADFIVEPISALLEIEHYVATSMLWKDGGVQAQFVTENCYGPEKLKQVKAYFSNNPGLKQARTKITVYSDSHSDIDILRWADRGIAVNPDRKLLALAKENNMPVMNWM